MPRPAGVRNRDFDAKRSALIDTLTDFALTSDLRRPSLRQFAQAAGASEPTLRHYFSDRQGVVIAILETIGRRGQALWDTIATPSLTPGEAVREYYRISEAGMRHGGFIRAHAFGIIEGVAEPKVARAYLKNVLEPALGAVRRKLLSTPGGPQDDKALRAASLVTLAPLLMMSLHQDLLDGGDAWPFDSEATIKHLETWLSAGFEGGAVNRT
ncbi:MAG: TetR/AcrR family transcriptional regulator [Pseudomonadota bacterium]